MSPEDGKNTALIPFRHRPAGAEPLIAQQFTNHFTETRKGTRSTPLGWEWEQESTQPSHPDHPQRVCCPGSCWTPKGILCPPHRTLSSTPEGLPELLCATRAGDSDWVGSVPSGATQTCPTSLFLQHLGWGDSLAMESCSRALPKG